MPKEPSDFFNETYLSGYFNRNLLKKGGGGRDNLTPERFQEKHGGDFDIISRKCLDGSYRFGCYNEKLVLKGSKKLPRVLSIPTVRDRLVLGVLNDYLSDVFSECVSHEIPNSLIYKIEKYINDHEGEDIGFLRTDFHDFYGSLSIKQLMDMLKAKITDKAILSLIHEAIITPTIAGSTPKCLKSKRHQGIPQGLSISNILASIYMYSFDEEFGKRSAGLYIRYVDDILFLGVREPDLQEKMLIEIKDRKLRLKLSKEKCVSGVIGQDALDFIGYVITDKIFIRKRNVTQYLNRIAALTTKCRTGLDQVYKRPLFIKEESAYIGFYIEEFNRIISGFKYGNRPYGWLPYFQAINDVSSLYGMDRVIRNNILKNLPDSITSKVNTLVDTYHDIRRHAGANMVANYDALVTIDQKRNFLFKKGRLDADKSYTDEQITNSFDNYMDLIRRVSERNIGTTS